MTPYNLKTIIREAVRESPNFIKMGQPLEHRGFIPSYNTYSACHRQSKHGY